jgi:micrococcal nuclease
MPGLSVIAVVVALAGVSGEMADPCEAIPDGGPAPAAAAFGSTFSGPVVHVIDGDSFCVALGDGPKSWVEVRLGDFYAWKEGANGPKAKAALEHIALGKKADCVANLQSGDRISARCWIGGEPIGDSLRTAGVAEEDVGSVAPASGSAAARTSKPGRASSGYQGQDVTQGAKAFSRSVAAGLKRQRAIPILLLP